MFTLLFTSVSKLCCTRGKFAFGILPDATLSLMTCAVRADRRHAAAAEQQNRLCPCPNNSTRACHTCLPILSPSDMDALAHAAGTSEQQGLGPLRVALRGRRCLHGRRRTECKDCGGSSICTHGRVKNKCKDCGGGGICTHGRERSVCKDCAVNRTIYNSG
jgi:hypothetical protein